MGARRIRNSHELKIELSPSQLKPVKRWVTTFRRREKHWIEYPRLEGSRLRISATAFPFFLAYVDVAHSNEFDVYRLRQAGRLIIRQRLDRETSLPARRQYQQALDNLDYLQVGEFL